MRIEDLIEISAPIDRVWELTVDVESWPRLSPTFTSVELEDDGLAIGGRARVKQPGQRARYWTVTELDPPRRFAWSATAMGSTMTGVHTLTESDGGTTNELAVEISGSTSRLVGPLLRPAIRRAIAKENQGFKAAAEGEELGPSGGR